jgi:hypothetical protein
MESVMDSNETIKALAIARDPHFRDAMSFLQDAGFDLRNQRDQARRWCFEKASAGDAQAQYVLAELLVAGLFGDQDHDEALKWCKLAADNDFAPALMLLAGFYESGWAGLRRSDSLARQLTERAAEKRYLPAMRSLGASLVDGGGDSASRGLDLLKNAAALGDFYSTTFLATRELSSSTDDATKERALESLKESASAGDPHANRMLGYFYKGGEYGLARDDERARSYFSKADELEDGSWRDLV